MTDNEWTGICPTSGTEVATVRTDGEHMYCDACDRRVLTAPIPGDSMMRLVVAHEARREVAS